MSDSSVEAAKCQRETEALAAMLDCARKMKAARSQLRLAVSAWRAAAATAEKLGIIGGTVPAGRPDQARQVGARTFDDGDIIDEGGIVIGNAPQVAA